VSLPNRGAAAEPTRGNFDAIRSKGARTRRDAAEATIAPRGFRCLRRAPGACPTGSRARTDPEPRHRSTHSAVLGADGGIVPQLRGSIIVAAWRLVSARRSTRPRKRSVGCLWHRRDALVWNGKSAGTLAAVRPPGALCPSERADEVVPPGLAGGKVKGLLARDAGQSAGDL
jgi:hypothetical protein